MDVGVYIMDVGVYTMDVGVYMYVDTYVYTSEMCCAYIMDVGVYIYEPLGCFDDRQAN